MRIPYPTLRQPPPLYRYMEPEFARLAVERGSFRLSTAAEAAKLEDGLRDDLDSGVRLRWGGGLVDDAPGRGAMKSLGLDISGPVRVHFGPGDIEARVHGNILCMTDKAPNDYIRRRAPEKSSLVRIDDVIAFGWALTGSLAAQLELKTLGFSGDQVIYDMTEFSEIVEVRQPSPFIKAEVFEEESEWRLYWATPEPRPTIIECEEACQFLTLVVP